MQTICGVAIDWSATGDMMAGLGGLIGAGAVIYAAPKAADTFSSWRKQKHHERCMIVAEDILTLAYKLSGADGRDHVAEAINQAIMNLEGVLLPIIRHQPD